MSITVVDRIYAEFSELTAYIPSDKEPSLSNVISENFRKALLIAAANYFERQVSERLPHFASQASANNVLLTELVKNRVIERQYHTLFDWKTTHCKAFLGMFGADFKAETENRIDRDDDLKAGERSFMEIGSRRNELVHKDFGSFPYDKSAEEIYASYKLASAFLDFLFDRLNGWYPREQSQS